jgi:hypothetical protein
MTYSDFTLDRVRRSFGLSLQRRTLFEPVEPVEVPSWLREMLERGMPFALSSEKARSEFIVAPVLLTSSMQNEVPLSIYSGQRLDVAPDRGLVGECDFVLCKSPPLPFIQSPIMAIVEAKKHDIEAGLGQCAAQMVGAQWFNQNEGNGDTPIFGCVTTGEDWQFLCLEDTTIALDSRRYYIVHVGVILGVFAAIVHRYR